MRGKAITKRNVDAAKPSAREYFIWDGELKGYGLRVQESGNKSYVVQYRAGSGRNAPTRRVTLARVGALTPDEAKKLAKRLLGDVAHGLDPAAAKSAERCGPTLKELADLFLSEHVGAKRKPATAEHYKHVLDKIVTPTLGARRADQVTVADIARLHARLRPRPYLANRAVAVMGSLYSFAGRRHLLPVSFNPARGIEKYPEKPRERFLTSDELSRLGDALREAETDGLPYAVDTTKPTAKRAPKETRWRTVIDPFAAAAIRLLILTGGRLREILHLRWEHVHWERGLLLLPDSKTGAKSIILNAPALAVLAGLPRAGAYVIAGQSAGSAGEKPRADLNRPWRAVRKHARLDGVRIHDLRHTHASIGAGAGLGLPIIGKLLGHTKAATTQRYAHLDTDPLRRASDRIGAELATALGEAPPDGARKAEVALLKRGA